MDKRLYFELLVELSNKDTSKDTLEHHYFEYYKTFTNFSFFFSANDSQPNSL